MSTDTIKNYGNQDVLKVFCPFCIEAANVVKGGREIVSKSCFQKYSIDQLEIHLNGKKHSRKQLVEVAMRPARASYWEEFEKIYSEEFEKILR
jgi:hypothetical protein